MDDLTVSLKGDVVRYRNLLNEADRYGRGFIAADSTATALAKERGYPVPGDKGFPDHHYWNYRTETDPNTGKDVTKLFPQRTDSSKTDLYKYNEAAGKFERIPGTRYVEGDPNIIDGAGSRVDMHGVKIYDPRFKALGSKPDGNSRFSDKSHRKIGGDVYFGENMATSFFEVRKNIKGKSVLIGKVKVDNMLDLTDPAVLKQMNIDEKKLTALAKDNDTDQKDAVYAYTHDISNKAYDLGYNGILFNSSRNPGENKKAIVLFGNRYDPNEIETILDVPITAGQK